MMNNAMDLDETTVSSYSSETEKLLPSSSASFRAGPAATGSEVQDAKEKRFVHAGRQGLALVCVAFAMGVYAAVGIRYWIDRRSQLGPSVWRPKGHKEKAKKMEALQGTIRVVKTYYINTADSTQRRETMERQLNAAGALPYERIEAVVGRELDDLHGDIGAAMVRHVEGCETCSRADNKGLCCIERSGERGPKASRALQDEAYPCGHQSAHSASISVPSHEACFHMMANWASHLRAFEKAREEFFRDASDDDHVLVLEDDAFVPLEWRDLLAKAELADPTSNNVLESMLGLAASDNNDFRGARRWDYFRADLDAWDTDVVFFDPAEGESSATMAPTAYNEFPSSPLTASVDWDTIPQTSFFSWGAGALLIRVKSLDRLIKATSSCFDLDWALNVGTQTGKAKMATFKIPVFFQNYSLGLFTTI